MAAEVLAKEFANKGKDDEIDFETLFLPKQAVKVNDTWKQDMDLIAKDFNKDEGMQIDASKSSGTGKLLKTYKKDGKQFGVMQVNLNLAVKSISRSTVPSGR